MIETPVGKEMLLSLSKIQPVVLSHPFDAGNCHCSMKRIPGAHISGTHCRRSSTQGNRLRESKDQLHEAI